MQDKTLDDKTEKEFVFKFKYLNLFALHDLFAMMQDFNIDIELKNDSGVKWKPSDGLGELKDNFSAPEKLYMARVRGTEKQIELYEFTFKSFSGYLDYWESKK